jgi:hypothetical protein
VAMRKAECVPGRRVAWWAIPAEPWGVYPVEGEVTGVGPARVRLRVRKATGEVVERWVDPRHLSPTEGRVVRPRGGHQPGAGPRGPGLLAPGLRGGGEVGGRR